jgi:hypothetical protein
MDQTVRWVTMLTGLSFMVEICEPLPAEFFLPLTITSP